MTQISALPVRAITGSLVTDDGQHMLLKMTMADGKDTIVAIPRSEILKLVEVAATSQAQSDKIVGATGKVAFPVTWWELGISPTNSLALSLTFGSGAKLSFELSGDMPRAILETLQMHFAGAVQAGPHLKN